jgi:hypothetical protein
MTMSERDERLIKLSQLVVNHNIHYKLDKVAEIYIHDQFYFNVFRRYNSVHEYIIEYMNGDIYLHKNERIRDSLQTIMCLSHDEIAKLYTQHVYSYKYHSDVESTTVDMADETWTDIYEKHGAICVNFSGILTEYYRICQETYYDLKNNVVVPKIAQEKGAEIKEEAEQWLIVIPKHCKWTFEYEVIPEEEDLGDFHYMILRSGRKLPKRYL